MDEFNVFSGKSVEEAVELGLTELGITREDAEITVLDEGKKKLIGGTKARVKVTKKLSDGTSAVEFFDGLMEILKRSAVS